MIVPPIILSILLWAAPFSAALVAFIVFAILQNRREGPARQDEEAPELPRAVEPILPETRRIPGPAAPTGLEVHVQSVVEKLSEHPAPVHAAPMARPFGGRRLGPPEPEGGFPPPRTRLWMEALRHTGCVVITLPFIGLLAGLWLIKNVDVLAGLAVVALGALIYLCFIQVALYLTVREGAQGAPLPQRINTPLHADEEGIPAGSLAEIQFGPEGLLALGFEPAGWYYIDRFSGYRIGAWLHPARPDVAYIILQPGGSPRVRFVRQFADGNLLVTTNKKTDLGINTPSVYVQMRYAPSAAVLWAWHRQATTLFPQDAPGPQADEAPAVPPEVLRERGLEAMGLYIEHSRRCCEASLRGRWWWLPGSGLIGELLRLSRLPGMSVKQQIEGDWAPAPPCQARRVD